MTQITWLGHGSWLVEADSHRLLLDPFLKDNPSATASPSDFHDVSHILISHGHFDHVAEAAEIANASGATLIANYELAEWFASNHGVENTVGMNIGGNYDLPCGSLKMTPAIHSSQLPDGSYGGEPSGFILKIGQKRIYFACDTALFSDMQLYAQNVDVAVLPIGDLFTMGIEDSVKATRLIEPTQVLPAHYGTWPPIAQDPQQWADRVRQETSAEPVVLTVGESLNLA